MTQALGKTIQIFLADGNPRGVKIAEFTSRTIQAVLVQFISMLRLIHHLPALAICSLILMTSLTPLFAIELANFPLAEKYANSPDGYFVSENQVEARDFYESLNGLSRSQTHSLVGFPAASETAFVYLPESIAPSTGYGLLVIISPSNSAPSLSSYYSALNELGIVAVAIRNAGNSIPEQGRIARALDAATSVMAAHSIDPERVYVGGHSGGGAMALIAMHLYPQVFRGSLSNCRAVNFPKEASFLKYDEVAVAGDTFGHRSAFVSGPLDYNYNHIYEKHKYGGNSLPVTFYDDPTMGHQMPSPEYFSKSMGWLDAAHQASKEASYLNWENTVFDRLSVLPWQRTPESDPDGDGYTNIEEFALGLDPTRASMRASQQMLSSHANGWRLHKRDSIDNLQPTVLMSTDLVSWEDASERLEGMDLLIDWNAPEHASAFFRLGFTDSSRNMASTYSDRDGLSDATEQEIMTDPFRSDTDGDSLPDDFEYKYLMDPLNETAMSLVHVISPMNVTEFIYGGWMNYWPDTDKLRTVSTRAKLRYEFEAPEPGWYVIQVSGHGTSTTFPADMKNLHRHHEMKMEIDEYAVGSATLRPGLGARYSPYVPSAPATDDTPYVPFTPVAGDTISFLSPRLESGLHDIFLTHFSDTNAYPKINITEIKVYRITDQSWADRMQNNFDLVSINSSISSPILIEAEARFPSDLKINGSMPAILGSDNCYTWLDLNEGELATTVALQTKQSERSYDLYWEGFDLSGAVSSITVKSGAAVKLTLSGAEENVPVTLNGVDIGIIDIGESLIHRIDQSGIHDIRATRLDGSLIHKTIRAVDYDFGHNEIALRVDQSRDIWLPPLPEGTTLTASDGLQLELFTEENATRISLSSNSIGTHHLFAKIESSGDILDFCKIETFSVSWSSQTNRFQSRASEQNFLGRIVHRNLPAWIRIDLHLLFQDIVFIKKERLTTEGPFGFSYVSEETQEKSAFLSDFSDDYDEFKFYYGVPSPLWMDYSNCVKGVIVDTKIQEELGNVLLPHF